MASTAVVEENGKAAGKNEIKEGKEIKVKAEVKEEKKRDRPVYDMPGQTRPTPDETDSLRKFYTSLRKQTNGESKMAQDWCLRHGLLEREEALKLAKTMKAAPATPSKKSIKKEGGGGGGKGKSTTKTATGKGKVTKKKESKGTGKTAKPKGVSKPKTKQKGAKPKVKKAAVKKKTEEQEEDSDDDIPLAMR